MRDPGELFAQSARGSTLMSRMPGSRPEQVYDLVLAVGTLDTVNDLPLALRLLGHGLQPRRPAHRRHVRRRHPAPLARSDARGRPGSRRRRAPRPSPDRAGSTGAAARPMPAIASPVVDIDRVRSCLIRSIGQLCSPICAHGPRPTCCAARPPLHRQARARRGHGKLFAQAAEMGGRRKPSKSSISPPGRPASLRRPLTV